MAGQEAPMYLAVRVLCGRCRRNLIATLIHSFTRSLGWETRTPIAIWRSTSNYVPAQEILNVTFVG
jgi:hypothetical protein